MKFFQSTDKSIKVKTCIAFCTIKNVFFVKGINVFMGILY